MPSRILKLMCLNDPNIREMRDTGLVKGETSSNRQAIIRVLEKKVDVGGKKLPAFYLAEPPSEILFEEDEFDDKHLKGDDGDWKRPSEAWLAERARRIDESEDRQREMEQRARELLEKEVAGGLAELLQQGRVPRARPPRQKRGEEGGGEG